MKKESADFTISIKQAPSMSGPMEFTRTISVPWKPVRRRENKEVSALKRYVLTSGILKVPQGYYGKGMDGVSTRISIDVNGQNHQWISYTGHWDKYDNVFRGLFAVFKPCFWY